MARVFTVTQTYARLFMLQINIRQTLLNAGWDLEDVKLLVDKGVTSENQWVKRLESYGLDPKTNKWVVRFWVDIDWDKHGKLLLTNDMEISVDWPDNVNPGLTMLAQEYYRFVTDNNLKSEHRIVLADHVRSNAKTLAYVRKELGLCPGEALTPGSKNILREYSTIDRLDELGAGIELASDD
ncbi:MAG: hypothetical protein Q4A82_06050 [Corynebacterium sp.]|nr:hypothetical protein [Corynebacterium sp.]